MFFDSMSKRKSHEDISRSMLQDLSLGQSHFPLHDSSLDLSHFSLPNAIYSIYPVHRLTNGFPSFLGLITSEAGIYKHQCTLIRIKGFVSVVKLQSWLQKKNTMQKQRSVIKIKDHLRNLLLRIKADNIL